MRLPILTILILLFVLPGCSSWPGSSGSQWAGAGNIATSEADDPKGAGPLSTEGALWWIGLATTVIGVAGLILKAKMPILPAGTAMTALPVGISTMMAADFLAQHQWLTWLMSIGLLILGVVELVGRKKIKRTLKQWAESLKETD